ncbi:uncharacterized protein LOC105686497 [Athalia rosae]|uniref:uncharacterized protein LOC105686497 n=1 Tax=Athalia rosae TaxID=37344 RepID=UPI0020348B1A|nr:uncharacterized protein LOC105686497 [Athalia rosae]
MDLMFMPEVLSYGALRHPQYRDYEQPWNKDYFSYGKSHAKARNQQLQKPAPKTPCLICKENKHRTLAAYIRGKARRNPCSEIHEEGEEGDEEEEEEEERESGTKRESGDGEKKTDSTARSGERDGAAAGDREEQPGTGTAGN